MRIMKVAGEWDFATEVDVNIIGLDKARPGMIEDAISWKASIKFRIDIEAREWGIKGLNVHPYDIVTIPVTISGEKDESQTETLNVSFDPALLSRDEMPSDSVTLGGIDLWLNPDLTPDYKRSTITVYGPTRRG